MRANSANLGNSCHFYYKSNHKFARRAFEMGLGWGGYMKRALYFLNILCSVPETEVFESSIIPNGLIKQQLLDIRKEVVTFEEADALIAEYAKRALSSETTKWWNSYTDSSVKAEVESICNLIVTSF